MDRLRGEATKEAETLRTEVARLTERAADLTRECANRYSQEQFEEVKRQTATENDTRFNTLRVEMREKCEVLANERDTYRRNTEDYVTQLSKAYESVQQQAA